MRRKAVDGLGGLGAAARDALPSLISALGDEDPWVRASAARALPNIAPESSVVALTLRRALGDAEPMVQAAAAKSLKQLSPP